MRGEPRQFLRGHAHNVTPAIERVERRLVTVDRGYATPCRVWTGRLYEGYGRVPVGTRTAGDFRTYPTHRVMYEHYVGPIPEGYETDHLCRQRDCAEPTHLEPVTRSENQQRGNGPRVARERHAARRKEAALAAVSLKTTEEPMCPSDASTPASQS